jgi:hypothetical protein
VKEGKIIVRNARGRAEAHIPQTKDGIDDQTMNRAGEGQGEKPPADPCEEDKK